MAVCLHESAPSDIMQITGFELQMDMDGIPTSGLNGQNDQNTLSFISGLYSIV